MQTTYRAQVHHRARVAIPPQVRRPQDWKDGMKDKGNQLISRVWSIVGAVIVTLAIAGGVIAGMYWLTVQAGEVGARWWAIVATLAVPASIIITYRLATHASREHLAGFDRGLDGAERTIQSVGRGLSATASLARSARGSTQPVNRNDDLLPRVGAMQLIEANETHSIVDL